MSKFEFSETYLVEEAECKKNLKCLLMNLFFEKYRIFIKILALHEHWDLLKQERDKRITGKIKQQQNIIKIHV